MRRAIVGLVMSVVALGLSACAEGNLLQDRLGWTQAKVLEDGWLSPLPYRPEPSYCYRTLADPECFHRAQPHAGERLIGYIGPPPR